jgi:hypothetical protein
MGLKADIEKIVHNKTREDAIEAIRRHREGLGPRELEAFDDALEELMPEIQKRPRRVAQGPAAAGWAAAEAVASDALDRAKKAEGKADDAEKALNDIREVLAPLIQNKALKKPALAKLAVLAGTQASPRKARAQAKN